jgi:hypothetical protein
MLGLALLLMAMLLLFRLCLGTSSHGVAVLALRVLVMTAGSSLRFAKMLSTIKFILIKYIRKLAS